MVSAMLKEIEDLFTTRFGTFPPARRLWIHVLELHVIDTSTLYPERGDRKQALDRLRVGPLSKTHHFSTYRSGLFLGLALPAIAAGSYLCMNFSETGQWYHSELRW
jgi:hypothetical protein